MAPSLVKQDPRQTNPLYREAGKHLDATVIEVMRSLNLAPRYEPVKFSFGGNNYIPERTAYGSLWELKVDDKNSHETIQLATGYVIEDDYDWDVTPAWFNGVVLFRAKKQTSKKNRRLENYILIVGNLSDDSELYMHIKRNNDYIDPVNINTDYNDPVNINGDFETLLREIRETPDPMGEHPQTSHCHHTHFRIYNSKDKVIAVEQPEGLTAIEPTDIYLKISPETAHKYLGNILADYTRIAMRTSSCSCLDL